MVGVVTVFCGKHKAAILYEILHLGGGEHKFESGASYHLLNQGFWSQAMSADLLLAAVLVGMNLDDEQQ